MFAILIYNLDCDAWNDPLQPFLLLRITTFFSWLLFRLLSVVYNIFLQQFHVLLGEL